MYAACRLWRAEIPLQMLNDFNTRSLILPPPISTCCCDVLSVAGFSHPERKQNRFQQNVYTLKFQLIDCMKERQIKVQHANRFDTQGFVTADFVAGGFVIGCFCRGGLSYTHAMHYCSTPIQLMLVNLVYCFTVQKKQNHFELYYTTFRFFIFLL